MANPLFRTKPMEQILSEAKEHQGGLKRVLSAVDLTAIGVGAIIGAGIFVLTGTAARDAAGPSIMLSYCFAGFTCILAALCYAEFASRLPISGSAYTYAYASVGELFAWIIGWDLILEYTIGSSAVAVGWTHYFIEFLKGFGLTLPEAVYHWDLGNGVVANPAAGVIILMLTALLAIGIKESARFNAAMVFVKVLVVLFVIFAGMNWVQPDNWDPFFPYGVEGVFKGAALIFFAYIGFDAVSTAAEETKNPQRDLPIGIISSLVICTILYIAVSGVITGMVPYSQIDPGAPLAAAFGSVGFPLAQQLIGIGGFAGLTTVMLILLMSQPRIYYSMARDGLLMPWFSKVHPKFRTPFNATILTGIIAATMAAFVAMDDLHHMVSIGTLFAFVVVSGSILIIRYKSDAKPLESTWQVIALAVGLGILSVVIVNPWDTVVKTILASIGGILVLVPLVQMLRSPMTNIPTTFKCPWVPFVPIVAMAGNIYMMANLNPEAWFRLWVWLGIGALIYFFYGKNHSRVALRGTEAADPSPDDEDVA